MPSVMTPEGRVSYPNVFKARLNKLKKKEEYQVTLLFPKGADLSGLKAAANEAMVEKFGADKAKWPKKFNTPFKDQGDREKDGVMPAGYEKGCVMLTLASEHKPGVVKTVGAGKVDTIIDPSEFYAGCFAKATVSFYAYDHESGQRGVNCSLNNICKTRDGDPLSGRPTAESEFSSAAGNESATGADAFDPLS